jgi:hypothetical protein
MSGMTDRAMCMDRASMDKWLPQEVLEVILGRETLCTARLVSRIFCAAASANICSLTFASTSDVVSLHRFPRLTRVTLYHRDPKKSFAELAPPLQDLVTTVRLSQSFWRPSHP